MSFDKNDPVVLSSLRDVLTDEGKALKLACQMAIKTCRDTPPGGAEDSAIDSFVEFVTAIVERNVKVVFRCAESEIERLMLLCIVNLYALRSPTSLLVTEPPPGFLEEGIASRRTALAQTAEWDWIYSSMPPDIQPKTFEQFAVYIKSTTSEEWTDRDFEAFLRDALLDIKLGLANSYELVLQPKFRNVSVEGKGVRADVFLWCPADTRIGLVVECDGYQFHSDKNTFKSDRIRDRAFRDAGYEIRGTIPLITEAS